MFENLLAVFGVTDVSRGLKALAASRLEPFDKFVDGKTATVRGRIGPTDDMVISPLAEKRCVAWACVFEECGKEDDTFELGRAGGGASFLLHSDHGIARVVPDGVLVLNLPHRFAATLMRSFGAHHLKTEARVKELAAHGRIRKPNWGASSLLMREYLFGVGDTITVQGHVTLEPNPLADEKVTGYREALPTRPVLSGTRKRRLLFG